MVDERTNGERFKKKPIRFNEMQKYFCATMLTDMLLVVRVKGKKISNKFLSFILIKTLGDGFSNFFKNSCKEESKEF